jgi:hypothetical protein
LRKCSPTWRPRFGLLGVGGERIERSLPELAVRLEPRLHGSQRVGVQDAPMDAAVDVSSDESRALQHLQVPRDRGEGHRERCSELGDGRRAASEAGKDTPAGRVTECAKDEVEAGLDRRAP